MRWVADGLEGLTVTLDTLEYWCRVEHAATPTAALKPRVSVPLVDAQPCLTGT